MFLVFAYDMYYPEGGWHDLVGKAETLPEAHALVEDLPYMSYVDIVDVDRMEIVWSKP